MEGFKPWWVIGPVCHIRCSARIPVPETGAARVVAHRRGVALEEVVECEAVGVVEHCPFFCFGCLCFSVLVFEDLPFLLYLN